MTKLGDWVVSRIFALVILLALLSVVFLWTLSPIGSQSQTTFAIYLSIDLVAFAMASYIFRKSKWREGVGPWPIVAGCVALLVLLYVGLGA